MDDRIWLLTWDNGSICSSFPPIHTEKYARRITESRRSGFGESLGDPTEYVRASLVEDLEARVAELEAMLQFVVDARRVMNESIEGSRGVLGEIAKACQSLLEEG